MDPGRSAHANTKRDRNSSRDAKPDDYPLDTDEGIVNEASCPEGIIRAERVEQYRDDRLEPRQVKRVVDDDRHCFPPDENEEGQYKAEASRHRSYYNDPLS